MKRIYTLIGFFIGAILFGATSAYAVSTFLVQQGGTGVTTFTSSQLIYGNGTNALSSAATTSATCSGSASCSPFTVIGSSPITISASGSGGSGTVSTSTHEIQGNLAYWTSNSATPALLGQVATSTIGAGTGLTNTGTAGYQVGGTNNTFSVNTTQNITTLSNLSTAGTLNNTSGGALYSTGTSSIAFSAPFSLSGTLGALIGGTNSTITCTNASSGVTGCLTGTDWNTFNGKQATISATWPVILTGTTLSFGGLSTSSPIAAGANVLYATGVNTVASAATTTLVAGTNVTFSGGPISVIGSTPLTINATGGGGGGTFNWNTATTYNQLTYATTTPTLWFQSGLFASSSSVIASTTFDILGNQLIGTTTLQGCAIQSGVCLSRTTTAGGFAGFDAIANSGTTAIQSILGSSNSLTGEVGTVTGHDFKIIAGGTDLVHLSNAAQSVEINGTGSAFNRFETVGTVSSGYLGVDTTSANHGDIFEVNTTGVGISSSTPEQKLSVQGNALISGNITSVSSVTATGTVTVTPLGTPAGTFIAADPTGKLIATTTPAGGSGTVTSVATNNGITGGTITTTGTIGLAQIAQGWLGNIGSASAVPISNATTTLFTGTTGQVAYFASSGGLVGTSSVTISPSATTLFGVGGTTTPGTTISFGDATPTWGINLGSATSTWSTTGGINLTAGCFSIAGTCITGGGGAAYPFQLTGNATSTLTQFNGGLTAYATSTIGDGTNVGGLTINGSATTTGSLVVQNSSGQYSVFGIPIGGGGSFQNSGTDVLAVGTTTSSIGARAGIFTALYTGGSSGSIIQGINAFAVSNGTGNLTAVNSTGGSLRNRYLVTNGSDGFNDMQISALSSGVTVSGALSSSTDAADFHAETPTVNSGDLITDFYGLWVRGGSVAGTITNRYGVFIDDLVGGVNRYGIYQSGSSDNNYFAGNLGLGTTSPYAKFSLGGGNLVVGAATAGGTLGDLFLPKLGTPAGTFLAADASGKIIATTTPSGGSGITSITGPTGLAFSGTPASTATLGTGYSIKELPSWTVGAAGADFTTIQAAMTQCGAVGGGSIYLVDPSYSQGGTGLTWGGSNCAIYGRNAGTTTISFTGATTLFKTNSAVSHYTHDELHNVLISGNDTAASIGIDWSDMTHGIVDGVQETGVGTGIRLNDTQNITFYNSFTNMDLNDIRTIGIDASSTNPTNANTFRNIFIGSTVANVIAFQMNNGNGNTADMIFAEPGSITGTVGLKLFDNTLSTNNGVFNNTFSNWYIEANATGVSIPTTVHPSAGGIQRNTLTNITNEANTLDWSVAPGAVALNSINGYDSNFGNIITTLQGPVGIATSTELQSIGTTPFSFLGVNASSTQSSNEFVIDQNTASNAYRTDLLINNSGYVGLGGSGTPTSRLTVADQVSADASVPTVSFTGDTTFAKTADILKVSNNNASDSGTTTQVINIGTGPSFEVDDQANDTTPFVVNAAGNVGISSTTPNAQLSINAPAQSTPYFEIGSTTSELVNIKSASTLAVGIGTTSPWRTFSVNGTVGFAGLTTSAANQADNLCLSANNEVVSDSGACLVSAKRFKTDITPLDDSLSEVLKLQPVSFLYKPDFNGPLQSNPNFNGQQVGFIADEVQKIDPRLVIVETASTTFEGKSYPAGTVQSVRYENLTALLAGAIQQQQAEIDALAPVAKSAEDSWQWGVIGLLVLWNIGLTIKRKK